MKNSSFSHYRCATHYSSQSCSTSSGTCTTVTGTKTTYNCSKCGKTGLTTRHYRCPTHTTQSCSTSAGTCTTLTPSTTYKCSVCKKASTSSFVHYWCGKSGHNCGTTSGTCDTRLKCPNDAADHLIPTPPSGVSRTCKYASWGGCSGTVKVYAWGCGRPECSGYAAAPSGLASRCYALCSAHHNPKPTKCTGTYRHGARLSNSVSSTTSNTTCGKTKIEVTGAVVTNLTCGKAKTNYVSSSTQYNPCGKALTYVAPTTTYCNNSLTYVAGTTTTCGKGRESCSTQDTHNVYCSKHNKNYSHSYCDHNSDGRPHD